jgi:FHA domain
MLGMAWLTLRQAQEALKNGRLEEAQRLLAQSGANGHKQSWPLLQQVAQGFVDRGLRHLERNDPEAAWGDLLRSEQVGAAEKAAADLRQKLTRPAIVDVRARLEAGQPARAAEAVALLHERAVRTPELQTLEETAKDWAQAQQLADRGEFAAAQTVVERLRRIWPEFEALTRFQHELEERRTTFARVLLKLHEAVGEGHWRSVVGVADEVLAVAPNHGEARKARIRAWQAIEPPTVAGQHTEKTVPPPVTTEPASRFWLWIDGVGGYLVCLAARVTVGQATPEATVDIPLFADVSRHHATLTRDNEGYLLEAVRGLSVNGKPADKALLQSGDRLTLGASCQLLFRQPVPVSATARIDLASGHRLPQAVEAVILMADTLASGSQAHVTVEELRQPVVLFRQKGGLGVRHAGPFMVDGQKCSERGQLAPTSRVVGEEFSFAVEPVGRGMPNV